MTPPDPQAAQPTKAWYWIGGGLILTGVIVGVVVIAVGFVRTLALPDFTAEFSDGQTVQVALDDLDEGTWRIYVDRPLGVGEVDCSLDGPDEGARAADSAFEHSVSLGNEHWELAQNITVAEPGVYDVICTSGQDLGYGIGQSGGTWSTLAAILLGIGIGAVGVVLGAVVLIVTAVRRSRAQRGMNGGPPPPHPHAPGW